jgi:hypothetical protein
MSILRITSRRLLLVAGMALLASCGDSTAPRENTNTLTEVEAQSMATGLLDEVSAALSSIGFSRAADFSRATTFSRAGGVLGAGSAAARTPTMTLSINQQCTNGGRIVGTLSINDNTNDAGTGTVSGTLSLTPQGCVVLAGTKRLSVNGDPSLEYAFNTAFIREVQSADFVWHATGGVKWNGGACRFQYTVIITPRGTGSISGTACGQPISGTF